MSVRNYVGARYVPKFAENPDWQENTAYEAMVIVLYHNSSYTSKIPVPPTVGNPAENPKYWALTGNYNAQIEEYRKASADIQAHARDDLDKTIADLKATKTELTEFKNTENTNNTELNNKITALRNNITINVENGNNASKYYVEAGELIYWKGKLYKNTDVIRVNAPFVTSGSDRNIVETTISDVVYNMAQQFKNASTSNGLSFAKLNRDLTGHINNKENPHGVTKAQVGLGNVDNVSKANILLSVYPVGSIYRSTASTSPAELFGGTWERIKDRFLLAAGDTYAPGSTGGEAKHTLTVNEIPSHSHAVPSLNKWLSPEGSGEDMNYSVVSNINTQACGSTGGGQAHNNMPPYLAVYIWKRVA